MNCYRTLLVHSASILGLLPVVAAQEPPTPPQEPQRPKLTAASTVDFLSLRDLLNAQVHNLMALDAVKDAPKAPAPAEATDTRLAQPVATIHDALFDGEGNLQSLLVSIGKRGDGAAAVVLPVREVRWHPVRKVLVTDLSASQIAGLTAHSGVKTGKPAEASARATWLATEMVAATIRSQGGEQTTPADDSKGSDSKGDATGNGKGEAKGAVQTIWYVPGANRIGFAVLGKSPRLVPWAVLKPLPGGPPLVLEVGAPAERLGSAPTVTDIAVPPDAAVRLQAYRHFAINLPPWDRPSELPKDAPRNDKGDK
jgi:hypothetical protein